MAQRGLRRGLILVCHGKYLIILFLRVLNQWFSLILVCTLAPTNIAPLGTCFIVNHSRLRIKELPAKSAGGLITLIS
jgi:hypothetical protein